MTNAIFDAPSDTVVAHDVAPQPGDVILAPQSDGYCLLARHPGAWQIALSSRADAVSLAVRYARVNGVGAWVLTIENQYERISAGAVTIEHAAR